MNRLMYVLAVAGLATSATASQAQSPDTTLKVTWGAFVDGYYAWDFQKPANYDRSFAGGVPFTTQPARHNEFNVNLAFAEVKADGPKIRGRLALQAGTSVQSNYSGEPTNGQISGPSLSRFIQEAVVGVKIAKNVWVDGGTFFSHMGMEGWVSRDNPTYTRSLVAEYSPYYQSGAKVTWTPNAKVTAQVDVVNGWQNVSENNRGKGAGARVDFMPVSGTTISYYNFFSQESGTRLRTFNGIGAKSTRGRITALAQFDLGTQDRSTASGSTATWYGATAVLRAQLNAAFALSLRAERFDDRHQVIVSTGALSDVPNAAFRSNGASIGMDWSPQSQLTWRTEIRGFQNDRALFRNGASGALGKGDAFAVTSLALTF